MVETTASQCAHHKLGSPRSLRWCPTTPYLPCWVHEAWSFSTSRLHLCTNPNPSKSKESSSPSFCKAGTSRPCVLESPPTSKTWVMHANMPLSTMNLRQSLLTLLVYRTVATSGWSRRKLGESPSDRIHHKRLTQRICGGFCDKHSSFGIIDLPTVGSKWILRLRVF